MRRVRDYRIDPIEDPQGWREALVRARIPDRYAQARTDLIRQAPLRDWVERACTHAPEWLGKGVGFYLNGLKNSGKSSIAGILACDALRRCESVLWLSVREVPTVVFRESPEHASLADRLRALDLLVIDDLGSERFRLTSAAGTALEHVVRELYDRHRSIIITANVAWADFAATYRAQEGFVSIVQRCCVSVGVVNDQWPGRPELSW